MYVRLTCANTLRGAESGSLRRCVAAAAAAATVGIISKIKYESDPSYIYE